MELYELLAQGSKGLLVHAVPATSASGSLVRCRKPTRGEQGASPSPWPSRFEGEGIGGGLGQFVAVGEGRVIGDGRRVMGDERPVTNIRARARDYELLLDEFVRLLLEQFGKRVASVLLFGSVARGTARPDSDVDVCVVIRGLPASRYRRHQLLTPVLERLRETPAYRDLVRRRYSPDLAAVLYTPDEVQTPKPISLDFVEDGILLWDDGTLQAALDRLRERMQKLGTRKVELDDGTYYWLLKPGLRFGEVIEL